MSGRQGRWHVIAGLLALWAAATLTRVLAGWGDDGLGGQDPWAYRDAARAIGGWLHGSAPPPRGFLWPLGYPLLGALLAPLVGDEGVALRLVSMVFGAAAAPLTTLLVWRLAPANDGEIGNSGVGAWLAGGVVAFGAAAVVAGGAVMADAATMTWLAAGALALSVALAPSTTTPPTTTPPTTTLPTTTLPTTTPPTTTPRAWRLIALLFVVGLCFGMAYVTRRAAAVAAPALVVLVVRLLRTQHRRLPSSARTLAGKAALALAGLAALALGLALPLGAQFGLDPHPAGGLDHAWVRAWLPANAWRTSFDTPDGHASYALPQAVFAAFSLIHPGYLAPPGLVFVALGARAAWRRWPGLALAFVGWAALSFALLAGMPFQNFRFGLMGLIPAAVAFGLGSDVALAGRHRRLAAVALGVALVWTLAWTPRMAARHGDARAGRRATVAAVAAAVAATAADLAPAGEAPRSPLCIAFELTADLHNRAELDVFDLSAVDDAALERLRSASERRPLVLVVDEGDLAGQWRGSAVAAAHARLVAAFDVGPGRRVGAYRVAHIEPRR